MSGTDVVDGNTLLALNGLECGDVCTSEVDDVDVVAYAGAVVGVIVVAEDAEFLTLAYGHLGDVGHEVVGDAVGVFADGAALVCTDGVEVAEEHDVPFLVGLLHVHEHLFEHRLGLAVGVGAVSLGALLGDGDDGRVAVDGGGAGEDDVLAAVLAHDVKKDEGAVHVVFVVFQRLGAAFAHGLEACEVDAGIEVVLVEHALEAFAVADVDLIEGYFLADDFGNALEGDGAGVVEVVDHHGFVACFGEFDEGVAADEAGAAGKKDFHIAMDL